MLTDSFKRRMDYLRVSLTDKCNLRCVYCMPREGVEAFQHDEILRNEEFIHLIEIFAGLGVKKIRFTGGEPLVRKGFMDIVSRTALNLPHLELCLTTNGILLDEFLDDINRIGLKKLNISLDTMSRERYREITGRDEFAGCLGNVEKALGYKGFDIKINAVLFEESIRSLDNFLEYFKDKRITLRFIEKMPFLGNGVLHPEISSDLLIKMLESRGRLERDSVVDTSVARMFKFYYKNKHCIKIGIIPPMTHKFCGNCNRLRLTCDGFLKTCLHSSLEYDLKSLYRMDMGDDAIRDAIQKAIKAKPQEHRFDYAGKSDGVCSAMPTRTMSRIGG